MLPVFEELQLQHTAHVFQLLAGVRNAVFLDQAMHQDFCLSALNSMELECLDPDRPLFEKNQDLLHGVQGFFHLDDKDTISFDRFQL